MATRRISSISRGTAGRSARAPRAPRFQDIAGLRAQLPKYWWSEVSRVRALIEADVETGGRAAELFEFVADALASEGEGHDADAVALWAASRKLSQIAAAASARSAPVV